VDKLQAIQTFVCIVEHGSLTAAAAILGRSLPSVVRTLAALEHDLDTRLLARTTRRIALTEEGRRYLEHARHILTAVQDAEAELSAARAEPGGHLSITTPVMFGQMHVVSGVAAFLSRHPQARVDMLLVDRVVNLVDEGIDIAVRIAHLDDSGLVARRVGSIRRMVCASPGYLARAGRPRHPRDVQNFESLLTQPHESGAVWRMRDGKRGVKAHPAGRFSANHVAGTLNACLEGLGLGRFLSYQVDAFVREGRLAVLLEEFEPPPVPVSLVHANARLVPTRIRAMVDWLAEHLAQRLRR
jgi:DNA-binding transcriptional LysR family regulator